MASTTINGSFQGSNAPYYNYKLECTSVSNGSNANTSDVTVRAYMRRNTSLPYPQWALDNTAKTQIIINGVSSGYVTTNFDTRNTTDWILLQTYTVTGIAHNDNGSKQISVSGNFNPNQTSTLTNGYASGTFTLDTIPRASSFTVGNGTLGTALGITITKQASSFTHTITWKCGSASGTVVTKSSSTSLTWNANNGNTVNLASQAPNNTAVLVVFTLQTYNGNTAVGSTVSRTISMSIPTNIVPSVSITCSDPTGYKDRFGKYIQNKSRLKVDITASGTYGSTIKQIVTTAQGNQYTSNPVNINPITAAADFTVSTTVMDSRVRTATDEEPIPVYAYGNPVISSLTAQRCDANGNLKNTGAYLRVAFNANVTALGQQNTAVYQLKYKKTTDTAYTNVDLTDYENNYSVVGGVYVFAAATSSSYDITLTVKDELSTASKDTEGGSILKLWSWLEKGLGYAFGKIAEIPELVDSAWRINSDVGFSINGVDLYEALKAQIMNDTHPVGSLYWSSDPTDPGTLFGGTWVRIKDRFILAAGDSYTNGSTGGKATHSLTTKEMPSHGNHLFTAYTTQGSATGRFLNTNSMGSAGSTGRGWQAFNSNEAYPAGKSLGGGAAHNNMPPYIAKYCWERTA